jgi:hypothetical protein
MKLCKDCKWWIRDNGICNAPKNRIVSPVNGETFHITQYCEQHRAFGWLQCRIIGVCGKEGRWWGPK